MEIKIDAQKVIHEMQGGIGASWHAMINEIPLENEKYEFPVREENPRGSGYGGNPPLSDNKAWNQLLQHASWLGINFIRVELSMRMYEPEQNVFDWENDEMLALYKILDWCEENQADVFLQQMWGHVSWNAHPGVHPLLSSPKSVEDFANGIATLLKYLTESKKYTCIKYFSMVNEPPGGTWGYWWESGNNKEVTLTEVWKKLLETFQKENISIPISAPNWTDLPPFQSEKITFDKSVGAYDIHSYHGIYNKGEKIVSDWVNWAKQKNKPFFITEIGNMNLGWGTTNDAPKSFEAALSNASDIVTCMNLGVDGFNRWSFTNRGDMDGQWQLVKTWDIESKTHTKNVTPEKEAYYGFAMLTRFLGKYPSVLSVQKMNPVNDILISAYKNQDGNINAVLVNNSNETVNTSISVLNSNIKSGFYLYRVSKEIVNHPEFELNPINFYMNLSESQNLKILPKSISVVSTNKLESDFPGIIR